MQKIRLYGDVSPGHKADFLFIKGVYGCKSNGDALEKLIETASPQAREEAAIRKIVAGAG